jgi:hypothetical protein
VFACPIVADFVAEVVDFGREAGAGDSRRL